MSPCNCHQEGDREKAAVQTREKRKGSRERSFDGENPKVSQLAAMEERANRAPNVRHTAQLQEMLSPANETGMSDGLKAGLEGMSGMDLSGVRVHYNSPKPAQLQALAYTQGTDIHVAPGQEQHLPHEGWHVVQQMQGRVQPTTQFAGTAINDDSGLEREADLMGAMAAREGGSVQRRLDPAAAPAGAAQRKVVQRVQPGAIEHAMNSCFVAALINTFTVVGSLKNLLSNNPIVGNPNAAELQDLLLRAVNTVDAANAGNVPQQWVKNIMVSLHRNNIIDNATDTADVNDVMALVIQRLTGANPLAGQLNNMPVSTGIVVWGADQNLQDAAAENIQDMQDDLNDLGTIFPNVIHVNRQIGNPNLAPQSFNLHPAGGAAITYRLRATINRDAGYVGGHFVSYVDRGDGGQEWWESDDIGPAVTGVADIQNAGGEDMLRRGVAYIYERSDAQAFAQAAPPVVAPLAADAQQAFDQEYIADLIAMVAQTEDVDRSTVDTANLSATDYDKDLQKAEQGAEAELEANLKLPGLAISPELHPEAQRQLSMQLEGLNRLTVKQWVLNTLLNRMKTTDQLISGFSTAGGTALKHKIDAILSGNNELSSLLMDEIIQRLTPLAAEADPGLIDSIMRRAQEAKSGENVYMDFLVSGGVRDLELLTRAHLKGGIGRQHGEGDEAWFRREHGIGVLLAEQGHENVHAVLHNPDQCAGGGMEIVCDPRVADRLAKARSNYQRALADLAEAQRQLSTAQTTHQVAPRLLGKATNLLKFFAPVPVDQEDRRKRIEAREADTREKRSALDAAKQVYIDLIRRHYGDSAVNSALGAAWMEELDSRGTTRVSRILDYALSIPADQWDETLMSVGMQVVPDMSVKKGFRQKSEKNKARKQEELNKLTRSRKRRRKTPPKKKLDEILSKARESASGPRQISLEELMYRSKAQRPLKEDTPSALMGRIGDLRQVIEEMGLEIDDELLQEAFQGAGDNSSRIDLYVGLLETRDSEQEDEDEL